MSAPRPDADGPAPDAEALLAGVPVEVDPLDIERKLAALWKPASEAEGAAGAVVRACTMNLIAFEPHAAAVERTSRVVEELCRRRPGRSLLLLVDSTDREAPPSRSALRASITAICHRPARGHAPVCCEQIRLLSRPVDVSHFVGAVAPLLVPDLPVLLWWRDALDAGLLPRLSDLADLLVVDSGTEGAPDISPSGLAALGARADLPPCVDLGWRRLAGWRQAIAEVFESPGLPATLDSLDRISIEVAPLPSGGAGEVASAALLAGWLATRLGWTHRSSHREGDGVRSLWKDRRGRSVSIVSEPDRDAGRAELTSPGSPGRVVFLGREEEGSDDSSHTLSLSLVPSPSPSLRVDQRSSRLCHVPRVVPLARADDVSLLEAVVDEPRLDDGLDRALARSSQHLEVR